ncbi:MAG: hypothetical protein J6Y13_11415 [Treponema sp.]|nr:hypothetical protein [Treponema sp.]
MKSNLFVAVLCMLLVVGGSFASDQQPMERDGVTSSFLVATEKTGGEAIKTNFLAAIVPVLTDGYVIPFRICGIPFSLEIKIPFRPTPDFTNRYVETD